MADVFASAPGSVMVVNVPQVIPAELTIEGLTAFGSAYSSNRVIITDLGLSEQVARSLGPSLGNLSYVSVFGDRPGDMQLRGIFFWDACSNEVSTEEDEETGEQVTLPVPAENGLVKIYQYYQANKMSARNTPVRIAVNPKLVFRGLLRGFTAGGMDPVFGIGQFGLSFDYLQTGSSL